MIPYLSRLLCSVVFRCVLGDNSVAEMKVVVVGGGGKC